MLTEGRLVTDRRSAPRHLVPLDSSLQSPGQARQAVVEIASREGVESLSDDVVLVVSELVTNAVRHAEPPLRLEVQTGEHRIVVAVADGCGSPPAPRPVSDDAEGGRGMLLVDLLADETGVSPHPPGKTVWASLPRA